MPNTPRTCNPQRTTKTARVWNNAIEDLLVDMKDSQCLCILTPKSYFQVSLGNKLIFQMLYIGIY